MSLELLGADEIANNPMVMSGGTLIPLPPPPSGYVYVHCEAGNGVREGYVLVPESVASSTTMITATNPATKETVWQIVPQGMDAARGKHLGQPYFPIHEKTVRTLDIAALKRATEMPPTVFTAPALLPPSQTVGRPAARALMAAGVAGKSCGADGDLGAWGIFFVCVVLLLLAWAMPRFLMTEGVER